jgi:hypothetical protein
MWDNSPPEGFAPLWLLLWTGLGVAGVTLPVYWLARRWWPVAGLAMAAWVFVPRLMELSRQYDVAVSPDEQWLYDFSPLLVLLALGIGLSGAMMGLSSYIGRRWSAPPSKSRPFREGFWVGLFVAICGWLLIIRLFALALVALLAGSLLMLELYFVVREVEQAEE